jgi:hypothetical protein
MNIRSLVQIMVSLLSSCTMMIASPGDDGNKKRDGIVRKCKRSANDTDVVAGYVIDLRYDDGERCV